MGRSAEKRSAESWLAGIVAGRWSNVSPLCARIPARCVEDNVKLRSGILSLILVSGLAAAQDWPFREYPAVVSREKPASPKLETPLARAHVTIIRAAVRRGPNFAGHYTVVVWGCGTACGVYVIVDNRTGQIYEPPEISKGVDLGFAGPAFRADSSLMIVASCADPSEYGVKGCQRKFYRWDGLRLVLLKAESVTAAEVAQRHLHMNR